MSTPCLGSVVTDAAAQLPSDVTLNGRTIALVRLNPAHAEDLYPHVTDQSIWHYLPEDVPQDLMELRARFAKLASVTDPFHFAIIDKRATLDGRENTAEGHSSTSGKAVGHLALMRLMPEHLCLEIGQVLFSTVLQKTVCGTEALYLLLRYAFDTLGYRRVEWKCNALNEGSRRAALRYGFTFEGLFRQHMVVKGRNRDTAWFSMLREEWNGGIKVGMESWLDPSNFDANDKQERRLEDIRKDLQSN